MGLGIDCEEEVTLALVDETKPVIGEDKAAVLVAPEDVGAAPMVAEKGIDDDWKSDVAVTRGILPTQKQNVRWVQYGCITRGTYDD
jgi:hypothetical protein